MPASVDGEELQLIARAKRGDLVAFEALYNRYKDCIYRTALAIIGDRPAAEEILQDTFLRAFKHMDCVHDGVSLSPWLHRIAVNLAYDCATRHRKWQATIDRMVEQVILPSAASLEQTVEERELYGLVYEAIGNLEFRQRAALVLFYLDDFSLAEIAEIMDCPLGTVKSRLYHARENLRRALLADQRLSLGLAYETT